MKTIQIIVAFLSLCIGLNAQVKNDATLKRGIYYIINGNGQAIEPLSPTSGNNVFLRKFNKSGMQKWEVIPQKDGSYLIKLYESELYLEPHPAGERTAWLDSAKAGYKIEAIKGSDDQWYIKSKARKGDAMRSYIFSPELATEIRFEPTEDDKKFKWKLISAE